MHQNWFQTAKGFYCRTHISMCSVHLQLLMHLVFELTPTNFTSSLTTQCSHALYFHLTCDRINLHACICCDIVLGSWIQETNLIGQYCAISSLYHTCSNLVTHKNMFPGTQHSSSKHFSTLFNLYLPSNTNVSLDEDGLLLETLHLYSPNGLPVTLNVWE